MCRFILKEALTPHLFFNSLFLKTEIKKQPSASTNPVINQGLSKDILELSNVCVNLIFFATAKKLEFVI